MIKNERQYRIAKSQLDTFSDALRELDALHAPRDVDPIVVQAQHDAIRSQQMELQALLEEYEALTKGDVLSLECSCFEDLPSMLIKARLSQALTQKELASRLGVKEQQVQRWESNDYAGATLETLNAVLTALGVQAREEFFIPHEMVTPQSFLQHIADIGIPTELLLSRLIPANVAAMFRSGKATLRELLRAATSLSRIYGTSVRDLMTLAQQNLALAHVATPRFKLPSRIDRSAVTAYTVYAHYLAALVDSCVVSKATRELPRDYHEAHQLMSTDGHPISFERALNFAWDCGVIVIPLRDPSLFHGAIWNIGGRLAVVLKQNTPLESRWLFDLLHELGHATCGHVSSGESFIEAKPISPDETDEEEGEANEWAEDTLFDGDSEEIANACVAACRGRLQRLKSELPGIAARFNVNVGSLANQMAYRLAAQGEDWWGAAHNLQRSDVSPFEVARAVLLQRTNLQRLNSIDRDLLMRAIAGD